MKYILLIVAAVLIFFYPVLLKNEVPIPADVVVGVYLPWLDYTWGYPTGVPVKNPITSDVVSFSFPMRILAVELLKQGQWPLWNPLILTGTPLLANFQSAPFSPTNIFYFLLDKYNAWSVQIIAQIFLAAVFLYLLLKEFGRSQVASTVGGLFFAFAGFLIIWMEWNAHSLVAAFFPLIILLALKWLKTGNLIWGVLLSITLTLQIFSGYPQIILYQFLLLPLLIFFFDKNLFLDFKKILGLIIFLGFGLGLAAIQILPGLELLKLSQRSVEDVINVSAFLPWQMIITLLAPDFFGNHATGNYWGPGDYTYVAGYSGVVVVALAGLGFLAFAKDRFARFSLATIILSLLIALPNPLTVLLKESGYLSLQAASAHRALVLSNLGFAMLAGFGIDAILEKKISFIKIIRALYLPAILLFSFGVTTFGIFLWLKTQGGDTANLWIGLRNLILPFGLLLFTGFILFLIAKIPRLNKILTVFVVVVAVGELFRFGWKFTPFSPKDIIFPKTSVIDYLQSQQQPFRVFAEDVIPINMLMPYGISRIEGYDALYPVQFAKYLSALNANNIDFGPMGRYGSVKNTDSNLLNLANVQYILAVKKEGQILEKFNKKYLKQVFEDKSVAILENLKSMPRAKMFYNWESETDQQVVLSKLLDSNFPVNEKIILAKGPTISQSSGQGEVEYMEKPNQKEILIKTDREGVLVISDAFYPGWQALVDGKKREILLTDYNFMAIPLESGSHEVVVEYHPSSFGQGKMISLISGSILFTLFLYGAYSQKFSRNT